MSQLQLFISLNIKNFLSTEGLQCKGQLQNYRLDAYIKYTQRMTPKRTFNFPLIVIFRLCQHSVASSWHLATQSVHFSLRFQFYLPFNDSTFCHFSEKTATSFLWLWGQSWIGVPCRRQFAGTLSWQQFKGKDKYTKVLYQLIRYIYDPMCFPLRERLILFRSIASIILHLHYVHDCF